MNRVGAFAVGVAALTAHVAQAQTRGPVAAPAAASAAHSPFDAAVAFGDSLSDAGNISIAEGEPGVMRYTTNPGRTASEYVAAEYGLPLTASLAGGTDFAYGGAGVTNNSPFTPASVPTETAQVDAYLAAHPTVDRRALISVFGGANDIFTAETSAVANGIAQQLIASATAGQTATQAAATTASITALVEGVAGVPTLYGFGQAQAVIAAAGTTEGRLVGQLQAAGARHVLVFALPDIGLTPQATSEGAQIAGQLTQLSQSFNAGLDAEIAQHPHGVIPVDTFDLIRETLANPARYGYLNTTVPACTVEDSLDCTPATLRAPNAATTYFFADSIHPTTATHELFAQAVLSEISAPSYISLLAEAPLAVATDQRDAWGNELARDSAEPGARSRAFASVSYDSQSYDRTRFAAGAENDGGVATLGYDWRVSEPLSLGVSLTGGRSFADFNDHAAKFRADTVIASLFGQYRVLRNGYVNAAAGWGGLDFDDVARSFALGPARQSERGATGGEIVTGTLTAGWWFGGPTLRVSPYVQGQYEHVRVSGYAEQGDDALSMTFGAQTREALVGEAGVRAQGVLATPLGELRPYAVLSYDHDGRAGVREVDAGLVLMPGDFSLPGYRAAADWGGVQAGLEWRFAPGWGATLAYQGRFADNSQTLNVGTVSVRRSF